MSRWLYRTYRTYSAVRDRLVRRFTPAGWLILVAIPASACMGIDTNMVATYQIFTFLCVVLLLALLTGRFCRPGVTLSRELPRFATVGEPFTYWLHVHNRENRVQQSLVVMEDPEDPRPSYAVFASQAEPGEHRRNAFDRFFRFYRWTWLVQRNLKASTRPSPVPEIAVNGRAEVLMTVHPYQRGILRFAGMSAACPDPLGLYRIPVKTTAAATTLILPKRYRLPPFSLPGTVRHQQGGVANASHVGESEEFASLREYRRGDPLTRIHWKSWAKTGKPIVKEFQQEYFVRHALILDTYIGDAPELVFEEAVSLAASFAATVDTRDSLLDLLFVGDRAHCFTVGRGVGHAEQMLEILATVQACREQPFATLEQLVNTHARLVGGCVCIFVGWDDNRAALVKRLQHLQIPLLIFLISETGDPPVQFHLGPGDTVIPLQAGNLQAGLTQ